MIYKEKIGQIRAVEAHAMQYIPTAFGVAALKRSNAALNPNSDEPLARTGLREQVTHRLLTSVFEGRFRSGERLVVGRLSTLFGVSPTPVRESLVELAGLGVVDLLPNRGAVVRPFGPTQLREMIQVRRILEVESARCASGHMEAADLDLLRNELLELKELPIDAERDRRAQLADTHLHMLIAEKCGNPRLTAEVQRYLVLFKALRNISHIRDSWAGYRRTDDVQEHLRIVRSIASGDAERAAKAMDTHIRSVEKTMTEIVFSPSYAGKTQATAAEHDTGGVSAS
jgi:DNA-binding GntR family transcriptional regulator